VRKVSRLCSTFKNRGVTTLSSGLVTTAYSSLFDGARYAPTDFLAAVALQAALAQAMLVSASPAQTPTARPHNVVLFIADGLRFRMVDDTTAPTMAAMARQGVSLRNSHALFPTFTMANASGMATGHMLGDTGTFSNTIYTGFEVPGAGSSLTPFMESDVVLSDVDEHFAGS
jgi:alkaline phosphatase